MMDLNLSTIDIVCKENANDVNKPSLGGLVCLLFEKYLQ